MRRFEPLRRAAVTGLLCACAPVAALADPIIITSGSFDYRSLGGEGGRIQFFGTDGFSLDGSAASGSAGPQCCLNPGSVSSFHGFWGGDDVNGVATYRGDTFTSLGFSNSNNVVNFSFQSSTFSLPSAPSEGRTVTMTAPFVLTGTFVGAPGDGRLATPTVRAMFFGSGIGSVPFVFAPEGFWDPVGHVVLRMTSPAEVVPEPASLILFGLGLAGAYGERYRRLRHTRRTIE